MVVTYEKQYEKVPDRCPINIIEHYYNYFKSILKLIIISLQTHFFLNYQCIY